MNVKMKFKSIITTEQSYPYSLRIEFAYDVTDAEDIFKGVYDYLDSQIKGIVSATTECLGIIFINQMASWEALEVAKQGIQNLND